MESPIPEYQNGHLTRYLGDLYAYLKHYFEIFSLFKCNSFADFVSNLFFLYVILILKKVGNSSLCPNTPCFIDLVCTFKNFHIDRIFFSFQFYKIILVLSNV